MRTGKLKLGGLKGGGVTMSKREPAPAGAPETVDLVPCLTGGTAVLVAAAPVPPVLRGFVPPAGAPPPGACLAAWSPRRGFMVESVRESILGDSRGRMLVESRRWEAFIRSASLW